MAIARDGYDEYFLGNGVLVPMPEPNLELSGDVLYRDGLTDQHVADYVHYSVVMSQSNRQAFFSAANLDQSTYRVVKGRKWFIDPRLGTENQVGAEIYKNNDWDQGHLTRRTAVTWGADDAEAIKASNESCSYANSCLQHANFNRDEWRVPEEIVRHFSKDMNDKICVITGPIFTETDRWYARHYEDLPVRIPGGFWKLVAYIGADSNELECQAYAMYQDALFLADRRGRRKLKPRNYQVSTTEISRLTGLEFAPLLYEKNPLLFSANAGKNKGPEGFKAPRSTKPVDLDSGVLFVPDDYNANVDEFQARRREVTEAGLPDAQ